MRFNHKSLKNLLKRQQEKEHPILLKAGISTADIQKLFDFENHQLNRDRAYYLHIDLYIQPEDETFIDRSQLEDSIDWPEQIENPRLYEAWQSLSLDEQQLIDLHVIQGLPLTLVAALLDKPYKTIARRYERAIQKLKRFFE